MLPYFGGTAVLCTAIQTAVNEYDAVGAICRQRMAEVTVEPFIDQRNIEGFLNLTVNDPQGAGVKRSM